MYGGAKKIVEKELVKKKHCNERMETLYDDTSGSNIHNRRKRKIRQLSHKKILIEALIKSWCTEDVIQIKEIKSTYSL